MRKYKGMESLQDWLFEDGFMLLTENKNDGNFCNWYAYRRAHPTYVFDEFGIWKSVYIDVVPTSKAIFGKIVEKVQIVAYGGGDGRLNILRAYDLDPSEVPIKLPKAERQIVQALGCLMRGLGYA